MAARSRAKAKRTAGPKSDTEAKEAANTEVKLKDTTRAMLEMGRLNHRLPKLARAYHARFARDRRKLGESNLWLMSVERDEKKRYKPGAGPEALQAVGSAGTCVGDCSGSSALSQDVTVETPTSSSSLVSNPRLRQRHVSPHPMQVEFSFGSD